MRHSRGPASGLLLLALLLMLTLVSCGGGSSAPDPDNGNNPGQGNGQLPGQQNGNGNVSTAPWKAQAPGDVHADEAPLGTNPAYGMTLLGGETSFDGSHSASAIIIGGDPDFNIIDLTMAKDGIAANFDLSSATFNEGEPVDLWIKYETTGINMDISRHWVSSLLNLNVTESTVAHPNVGTYTAKLDWNIPMGTAGKNGNFNFDLTWNAVNKVSPNFPFNITGTVPNTQERYPLTGDAQIAYEDLLTNSDYDYNDFVCKMNMTEWRRNSDDALIEVDFTVKALARAAGYNAAWQFNISNAFPGAQVTAIVKQYYANGTLRHTTNWSSSNGTDLPVFTPTRDALPNPPGSYATNGIAGTQFVDGDYATVQIFFNQPFTGEAMAMPYNPLLKVTASQSNVYSIGIWKQLGDTVDTQGNQLVDVNGRPLAFVVPVTYAWPLEGINAWNAYSTYNAWANWIKGTGQQPSSPWYNNPPTTPSKAYSRDKFTPYP
ncbi:LruC domain-containing protein [bacterium]|nr:LruC domain-containing protein [bacterium]